MAHRGKKLDDQTREGILAHYACTGSTAETARMYQVLKSTVRRLVKESPDEFVQLRRQKRKRMQYNKHPHF
ncbi:hypothetical protein [Baia soyae]|uniref:Helix-turn-helix protein n=1 Tax=Baia soyae TaxID=1544746 RepID=A0A4R2RI42_9BACL|nr:hypothetical protein [Baia soyae]TCP62484.1 hypothetical protein EDD57_15514 [Baia soyae]